MTGFLVAAFITTHLPPKSGQAFSPLNDKLMHFLGFTLLGMLVVWRRSGVPRPSAVWDLLPGFVALALYGVLDEMTQPPFGRDCEFYDWLADCGGAAAGLWLGALVVGRPR